VRVSAEVPVAMQRYMEMAPALESDWVPLARQLGIGDRDVLRIQLDHVNVVEQAAAALRLWARAAVTRSNGSELEAALRHIGRLDIVDVYFVDTTTATQTDQPRPRSPPLHGKFHRCHIAISFAFILLPYLLQFGALTLLVRRHPACNNLALGSALESMGTRRHLHR